MFFCLCTAEHPKPRLESVMSSLTLYYEHTNSPSKALYCPVSDICKDRPASLSTPSISLRLSMAKLSSMSLVQQVYPWGQMRRCSPRTRTGGDREGERMGMGRGGGRKVEEKRTNRGEGEDEKTNISINRFHHSSQHSTKLRLIAAVAAV